MFNTFTPQQSFNFPPASIRPFYPTVKPEFSTAAIKRHQSFHGFQNKNDAFNFPQASQSFTQPMPLSYFPQHSSGFIPLAALSASQNFQSAGPLTPQNRPLFSSNRVRSFGNLNQNQQYQVPPRNINTNKFFVRNPFSPLTSTARVVGRKESQMTIRKIAPKVPPKPLQTENETRSNKSANVAEKRFGSLEIKKKHRCYSPTFYSLRCKKHAKKRPIIYAIPKKSRKEVASFKANSSKCSGDFQNLTDSIQIFEQNSGNTSQEFEKPPKPAPRCKKAKGDTIYQNFSANADLKVLDSSNDGSENFSHEISTTEAVVHKPNESQSSSHEGTKSKQLPSSTPKSNSKDSPTVMVRPSFVKPKVESPKGALSQQIQAKLKASPSSENPAPSCEENHNKEANCDSLPFVPEMPILDKWDTNKKSPPSQVCSVLFVVGVASCYLIKLIKRVILRK